MALMVETEALTVLAKLQWEVIEEKIKKDPAVPIDEWWVITRFRLAFGVTLWGAVIVEAMVLASIPFVPDGAPDNGWQWFLLVIGSGYVLLLFSGVAAVLQSKVGNADPLAD